MQSQLGMGVIYVVLPLDTEVSKYLQTLNIEFPLKPSRNPTPKEVRTVCGALRDLKVEIHSSPDHGWQVSIQGLCPPDNEPWTTLNISSFNGDENAPHVISFSKGWPSLILRIVRELTVDCGPLVIFPDSGCNPIVVKADDEVRTLLATWEHTREVDC